jgi:two-component system, OmpR family, response regulator
MVSGPTVLIAEDDGDLRALLARGLEEEGFATTAVATGAELMAAVARSAPDALVLDIGLPDADGRDACQALRAQGLHAPVLFLTARDAVVDRVAGFDAGGDDYLTKPFAFAELLARLRALLKRAGPSAAVTAGTLRLDPVTHGATCGAAPITLTPTEFRILAALCAAEGATVARRELVRAGWPDGAVVHDNTLDVYLARLRRKLGAIGTAPAIMTIHGVGYQIR